MAVLVSAQFTTPGSTSWTAPAGVTQVWIFGIGSGGAGGGGASGVGLGGGNQSGGAGGGGATGSWIYINVTPGTLYSLNIATPVAGGSGGIFSPSTPATNGANGNSSSFTLSPGNNFVFNGGQGGQAGSGTAANLGGTTYPFQAIGSQTFWGFGTGGNITSHVASAGFPNGGGPGGNPGVFNSGANDGVPGAGGGGSNCPFVIGKGGFGGNGGISAGSTGSVGGNAPSISNYGAGAGGGGAGGNGSGTPGSGGNGGLSGGGLIAIFWVS